MMTVTPLPTLYRRHTKLSLSLDYTDGLSINQVVYLLNRHVFLTAKSAKEKYKCLLKRYLGDVLEILNY
jgi:hypothetical protein